MTVVTALSFLAVLPSTYAVHAASATSRPIAAPYQPGVPGGWSDANLADPATHLALAAAVTKMNTPGPTPAGSRFVVETIDSAKVQVVAGANYAFQFRAALLVGDELTIREECSALVVTQAWRNFTQVASLGCIDTAPVASPPTAAPAPPALPPLPQPPPGSFTVAPLGPGGLLGIDAHIIL